MRRQIAGLRAAGNCVEKRTPDGIYLVCIHHIQYRKFAPKPFFTAVLTIVEPQRLAGNTVSSRIYCNPRALWKFSWFLRDFGYDKELLELEQVDEQRLGWSESATWFMTECPSFVLTALHTLTDGKNFHRPKIWMSRHPKWRTATHRSRCISRAVSLLSTSVSASLHRWLEREGRAGCDAIWACVRAGVRGVVSARRPWRGAVSRMGIV